MKKNAFFSRIERFVEWYERHQKELYFLMITFFVILSLVVGGVSYHYYSTNPLSNKPTTLTEHLATPLLIATLLTVITLMFGLFFTSVVLLSMVKRIKINKMEVDFQQQTIAERRVKNRFEFISAMLASNLDTLAEIYINKSKFEMALKDEELPEIVLNHLCTIYKKYVNDSHNLANSEVYVQSTNENLETNVEKLYKDLRHSPNDETSAVYVNRLLGGQNLLVGLAKFKLNNEATESDANEDEEDTSQPDDEEESVEGGEDTSQLDDEEEITGDSNEPIEVEDNYEEFLIIFKTDYHFPFEQYDIDAMKSIIEYSKMLNEQLLVTYHFDS